MKKWLKFVIGIIGCIILLFMIDMGCIFTINRPLLAKKVGQVYYGLFYDTYNCLEYSVPQIKAKGTKFSCATSKSDNRKVKEIVDKTKMKPEFSCAMALEKFYADDKYTYYYSCIKGDYVVVKYENGDEETVENALKAGTIKISDLDKYHIDYLKYENNNLY